MGRGRSVIGGTLHTRSDAGRRPQVLSSTASFPLSPRDAEPRAAAPGRPARDGPALRQRPGRHAPSGRVPQAAAPRGEAAPQRDLSSTAASSSRRSLRDRARRGAAALVRPARQAVAAAGADQPVARPGRRLGRRVLRAGCAHRRPAHRRRHRRARITSASQPATPTQRRRKHARPVRRAAASGRRRRKSL